MSDTITVVDYTLDLTKAIPDFADILAKELNAEINVDPKLVTSEDLMVFLSIPVGKLNHAKHILTQLMNAKKIVRFALLERTNNHVKIYVEYVGPSICNIIRQNNFEILSLKVSPIKETYMIRNYRHRSISDRQLAITRKLIELRNAKTTVLNTHEIIMGSSSPILKSQKETASSTSHLLFDPLIKSGMIKNTQEIKKFFAEHHGIISQSAKSASQILAAY